MKQKGTTALENGMIWFGAAVSISEILTGTLFAPLGFAKGSLAIVTGHAIGCLLLYLAGLIGGETRLAAMESVKLSFGNKGYALFSILNILQLVGWTAIMIATGAVSVAAIVGSAAIWNLAIGLLIIAWILVGITNLGKINTLVMSLLFLLTIFLSYRIVGNHTPLNIDGAMSFGSAVELSVAMPLSWLPLISDYTRESRNPRKATMTSAIVYFLTSCWMYFIGMGAALFTGESDMGQIILKAGIGVGGIFIIVVSTVTTTFLDAYSGGVSIMSLTTRGNEKFWGVIITIIGILVAIFTQTAGLEPFLYLIGSVFAPMIAIMIADYFILKRKSDQLAFDWINIILWAIGFMIYRMLMRVDTPIGSSLPAVLITMIIAIICRKMLGRRGEVA